MFQNQVIHRIATKFTIEISNFFEEKNDEWTYLTELYFHKKALNLGTAVNVDNFFSFFFQSENVTEVKKFIGTNEK